MSKRDHDAISCSDSEPVPAQQHQQQSNKRRREPGQAKSKSKVKSRTDTTYGQLVVFPGLDDATPTTDQDLEYEDETDALAYLRSVRQEANGIPHLLVAPKAGPQLPPHLQQSEDGAVNRDIYSNGVGDSRGYYYDGAYAALPDDDYDYDYDCNEYGDDDELGAPLVDEEGEYYGSDDVGDETYTDDPAHRAVVLQDALYASLLSQFNALRALLHQKPPSTLVDALPRDHGTHVGSFGPKSKTFQVWSQRIRYTDPLPVQIAAMDRHSALKLLRIILGGKFIRRGYELRERTSRWIWALLARLPDRGEMDADNISWVRELGKRAVLMMVSIAQMAALREEVEGVEGDGVEEDDVEVGDLNEEGEVTEEKSTEADQIREEDSGARAPLQEIKDEAGSEHVPCGNDNQTSEPEDAPLGPVASNSTKPEGNDGDTNENDENDGEMDMDIDDGEVSDDSDSAATPANIPKDVQADITAAKARLLAQLEENTEAQADATELAVGGKEEAAPTPAFDESRSRLNMRATLNMILTVAGELYGQRDLLEFRDPFPAL